MRNTATLSNGRLDSSASFGYGVHALTRKEIEAKAPSVYAPAAQPDCSEKYRFVNTGDILGTLGGMGYQVVNAAQSQVRDSEGKIYAKHVVRLMLEQSMDPSKRRVGDFAPQIILTNSHNRTSSFQLIAGLYRFWCANGCATSVGEMSNVRVLHTDPSIHDHIIEGVGLITDVTERTVVPMVERMNGFELTMAQAREFAEAASALKNGGEPRPTEIEGLLTVNRPQDEGMNFWNVWNRIQENAVRGGFRYINANGQNIQSVGIKAIDRDLDFNLALFQLGARALEAWA